MITPPPPFWKRKRCIIAAGVIWVVVAYLAGVGPVVYVVTRGWISAATAEAYMQPFEAAYFLADVVEDVYEEYVGWWEEIAEDHAEQSA